MLRFLEEEQIDPRIIEGIKEFRKDYAPEADEADTPGISTTGGLCGNRRHRPLEHSRSALQNRFPLW